MARMMGRNRKRSSREFTPFTDCPCCDGPTPKGRAAEEREWKAEAVTHPADCHAPCCDLGGYLM